MSETGPRIVPVKDPTAAVAAIRGMGRRIVTFVGFSGGGYEEPARVGELLAGFLKDLDPASVVCSGATPDGIGAVYPMAKARGFATIGIVSAVAQAEHVGLSDAVDTVYVVDDKDWGGRRPDGTLSPTSDAMVAASGEIIAIGGGDIARDEVEAAIAAGKPVRYEAADMNHALAAGKARGKGEAAPLDFKGPVHAVMSAPARADRLCEYLSTRPTLEAAKEAASLLVSLRDLREYERLCALAEFVCRLCPDDAKARRLYAQGLIETGRLSVAVDVLEAAKQRYGKEHSEYAEFEGLLGRAYKQLFMDTKDPQGVWARDFIKRSFDAYSEAHERDRVGNFWHGINLGALARVASLGDSLRGIQLGGRSADAYTFELLVALEKIPAAKRDQWWYATTAEAHAARGEWEPGEEALRAYINDERTTSFMLASTLRQLRDLWAIQREPRGARLLQMLEATLMARPAPGAALKMGSTHLREMRALQPMGEAQAQRLAGPEGITALMWYREGLRCAAAVAAVKERLQLKLGTGFAVRAAEFGIAPGNEVLLLTNFHVLSGAGLGGRKDFGNVEVVFEAIDAPLTFTVRSVVAESNADNGLDYALLRLDGPVERLQPLRLKKYNLPAPDGKFRVFIIGYPLGDTMQFSLQNNLLCDHECDPDGKPPIPARRRVQYSASTEKGSSGSPVFDQYWDCIALHHAGPDRSSGRNTIPPLNGRNTAVEYNEGIWIGSIIDDVRAKNVTLA